MVYLAINSLVLSIFGLFRDFARIPMYGENEKNCGIPTYKYICNFNSKY